MRRYALSVFSILFLVYPSFGLAQFQFAAPFTVPTHDTPFFLATGDFNQDGHLDLVACNRTSNDVSIFLGNGNGRFPSRTDFSLGVENHRPTCVVVADINKDGSLDIAVTNFALNSISILHGDGQGSFSAPVEFPTNGPTPSAIVAADFDRDGRIDLAVSNRAGHTVHTGDVAILQQTTPGQFVDNPNRLPGRHPRSLFAADLNRDNIPDLVTANFAASSVASVDIFLGKGDGTFADPIVLATALGPVHIRAADLNGDNKLDLVVGNRRAAVGQPGTSVYLALGLGNFQAPIFLPAGELPAAVAAEDLDGDGHCDIAVISGFSDDLRLYRGDGSGQFADPVVFSYETGITPRSLVSADLDHDGDQDLVIANKDNNTLAILINQVVRPVGVAITSTIIRTREPGVVELSWETIISGAAVHIYRQWGNVHTDRVGVGERTRLTDSAITVSGSHRFVDTDVQIGQTYTYWLEATDLDGSVSTVGPLIITVAPPDQFDLAQNTPNPFNAGTTIAYRIARPCHTTLTIYNVIGGEVATLVDQYQATGYYTIRWDGRNDHGESVGSGVYLYTLRAGAFIATHRMTLLK
ncbi:MAG: FG-GAP-like repeat-containing protein [Candidatus Latescibacteria bacterium]|jgi:hypothetical protein|nr:FG-GAP-like repeat-containing protein [Candidatus Latescibacterota bacterium]